jgi:hypothetical protein
MRTAIMLINTLALLAARLEKKAHAENKVDGPAKRAKEGSLDPGAHAPAAVSTPARAPGKKLFFDVHDVGKGKVTARDVAAAHEKDRATQAKYGVDYKAYWFDEKHGKIYCLAEAPSAEAANQVHQHAHGLVANKIMEVTGDNMNWVPTPGMKLYLDVHHMDPTKVTAKDVAGAHQRDLAVQAKHDVKYLNYWFDAESGTIMCLIEGPSAEAALAGHREAHGLMPDAIEEVSEGR